MHWLMLSLKLIRGEIGEQTMRKVKCIRLVLLTLYMSVCLALYIYLWVMAPKSEETSPWIQFSLQILYICLAIMFTVVIIRLNGVMKRMTGNFDREIRSVNC